MSDTPRSPRLFVLAYVIFHLILALAVVLWPALSHAKSGDEAIVLVIGPDATKAIIFEAARRSLKERGYVVHDPSHASAVVAMLGGIEGMIAGQKPIDALRDQLGVDIVFVIQSGEPTSEGAVDVTAIAATKKGAARRASTATPDNVGVTAASLVGALLLSDQEKPLSATEDAVYLKDGMVLTGHVKRQEPGQFVELMSSDGRAQTIAWEEIQRVVLAPTPGGTKVDVSGGGIGLEVGGTLEESDAKRKAWQKRGGGLVSYEFKALVTGILMDAKVPCVSPSGRMASGLVSGHAGGGGGGVGLRLGFLHLSPPNPETRTNSWFAFRLGTGIDFSYMSFVQPTLLRSTSETDCGGDTVVTQTTSFLSLQVPFPVGFHVGLGGFGSGAKWRGLVLGVAYAPSISYTKPSEGDGTTNFNPAGFDVTFDITSLEASLKDYAKEAHFRVSFFILPPIADLPLIGTFGLGAVWY